MIRTTQSLILGVTILALLHASAPAQGQGLPADSTGAVDSRCRAIFDDIQAAITSGNVSVLSRHFAAQVDINLRGGENGTFSANQAFYVLEDFLRSRRFGRLRFSTMGEVDANPYATGSAEMLYKGNRQLVQVYVALTNAGAKHVITQLNIY